ncbi:hypothetical protein [Photorhabdus heterorhabditis]|uniref:Uncharacterized protein n=1 Tax=Photorhabdus heterorhabditis TaxID=880156 RepID=A0A5B0WA01_9GAMM|nr:hypothetical protein [Photorhabdus heterorhabditis]KAA1183205.1 hypothetical protein F0L16_16010 [Photorhabdus heterorhabditis]KOY62254.1 hypothetical protein AM629_09550 [Photorhabdus heterorhabditis]
MEGINFGLLLFGVESIGKGIMLNSKRFFQLLLAKFSKVVHNALLSLLGSNKNIFLINELYGI